MTNGEINVTGGTAGGGTPSKGKRVVAGLVDLVAIPIVLGVAVGLLLIVVPEPLRTVILVLVNIAWLIVRDAIFSPGRKLAGLKLVSASGDKVTVGQAFIRNILLAIPFILVAGYLIEIIFVFVKGNRLADQWAKTRVVSA